MFICWFNISILAYKNSCYMVHWLGIAGANAKRQCSLKLLVRAFFSIHTRLLQTKIFVFFSINIIIHLHLNNIQTTNCTSIYQWHIEFVNRLQLNYLSCTRFVMNRLSLFSSFNLGHLCCVLSFCSIVSFAQVQQAHTFCDKEK